MKCKLPPLTVHWLVEFHLQVADRLWEPLLDQIDQFLYIDVVRVKENKLINTR